MKVLPPVGIVLERMMTMSYFYKLEENKMSILEVEDCIGIDSELHVQHFFKGTPVPVPQWFRQEIAICLAKVC